VGVSLSLLIATFTFFASSIVVFALIDASVFLFIRFMLPATPAPTDVESDVPLFIDNPPAPLYAVE